MNEDDATNEKQASDDEQLLDIVFWWQLEAFAYIPCEEQDCNVDRDGAMGKRGDDVRLVGNARQDEVVVRLLQRATRRGYFNSRR